MAYDITARLNVVLNQGDLTKITNQLNRITSPTPNTKMGISVDTSSLQKANSVLSEARNNMVAFGEQSGLASRRFAAFSVAAGGLIVVSQGIRSALSEAILFDREMVRLKQVSIDAAGSGVAEIRKEIDRLATGLGVSSSQLARVSVVLKQANLSLGETKSALEALALSALAPNFDSMEKTAEGAIAIMKQFKVPAEELASALGAVNAVAGEFAVEASDLISVIQRTGGAFKAAGGSLNELLALFTSVRQTTRESAESIATGLRTIFTRLQRTGTADALKEIGVNLRYTREEALALNNVNLTNQFVGAYEAVSRLSAALNEIPATDPKFARLVEEIGGYRQISKVIPLIQEFSVSQQALNVAIAGGSSLMSSAQAAQGSFGNRLDKIAESYLSFGRSLSDTSSFKTIFTMFEMAAKSGLILLEVLKPLLPMLTTIATMSMAKSMGSFGAGFATTVSGKPAKKSAGGPIGFKNGGIVPGHGSGDIVPAMLEPGEIVIPKRFAPGGNINTSTIKGGKKFEEVFKDSKFRDEETGEHKIGYHGTRSDFDTFKYGKTKRNFFGKGFYHTTDRESAESYSGLNRGDAGANVMANALNMKNPFNYVYEKEGNIHALILRAKLVQDKNGQITKASWDKAALDSDFPKKLSNPTFEHTNKILARSPKLQEMWWTKMRPLERIPLVAHSFTKALQKQGYDSINVDYGHDGKSEIGASVVFRSNQIKSVHGNDGSWDEKNSNINKALGGAIIPKRFAQAGKVSELEVPVRSTKVGITQKKTTKDAHEKGEMVDGGDNISYKISKFMFDDPDSAAENNIKLKGAMFEKAFSDHFGLPHTYGNYPVDFIAGNQPYELKNHQEEVSKGELLSKLLRHRRLSSPNFFANTHKENETFNAGELKVVYNSSNFKGNKKGLKEVSRDKISSEVKSFERRLKSTNNNVAKKAIVENYHTQHAAFMNANQRREAQKGVLLAGRSKSGTEEQMAVANSRAAASGGFIVPGVGSTDSVPMDLASGSYVIRKSSTEKLGLNSGGIVPALLTPGEAVFSPQSAAKIGSSSLERMNKYGKFAAGGRIGFSGGGEGDAPFYGLSGLDVGDKKLSAATEKVVAELTRQKTLSGQSNDYIKNYNESLAKVESAVEDFAEMQKLATQLIADPNNVALANRSAAATAKSNASAEEIDILRKKNEGTMDHVSGQVYGETSAYLQSLGINPNTAMAGSGLPGTERGVSIGSASGDIALVKIASEESRVKSDLIKKIKQQILTIDSSISSENAAEMADKEYARIRSGQSKVLTDKKGNIIGTSGYGDVLSGMGQNPEGKSQKSSAIKNFLGFGSAGAGASPEEKAAQKQSNMMQRTMLMAGASSYGMEFLNSQIGKGTGKDATDAIDKKTEGSFAAGQGVSGGATGAMTGGLMAASMGLSGPLIAVTAVAIGLYSAFNALKEATIALAKAEQEQQETKTKEFLRDTVSGRIKGDSSEINKSLSDLKIAMLKTAKSESGMFDSERDVLSKTNKNMEKFLVDNNPQIAKSASMGIKEAIIGAGQIKDVEKFVQELIKGTPAIRENIAMSRKAGETLAEATEKIKKDAIGMARAANNVEPMKKFNERLQSQAMALKTFSDAINVALVRMVFLSSSFDHLSEVLDNPIRSIGMGGLNKNAQIISSPEGFSKEEFIGALEATFSQFGKFGQQSIKEFEPLSQIGAILPNLIARAGTDKDPATKLEELLKSTFGSENQQLNKIISSIVARVNQNDNLAAQANQDPSKMAEELLAPFMGPLAKYGKIINSLQLEFANKFSASLAKLNSAMIKYLSDIEKKSSMEEDLVKMKKSGLNLLETGADPNAADPKRALMIFEQSQNRLLSNGRKMDGGANVTNDIASIKRGLIASIDAQSAAQVKMDQGKGGKESTDAMSEFSDAGKDIHIFRTALENFVSKSGQLIAEFDKQIGELLSQRGAGVEAIKKYAMSDPQSKMQFHQGQNLFNMLDKGRMNPAMAVNNPEILKSMYSFADSMGDFKIFKDSQGNDVTAKQSLDTQLFLPILKQMRPDLGDDKLRSMISGRNSVQERAIEAQSALSDVSKKLIDAIKVDLINSQKALVHQLLILNAQMALNYERQVQTEAIRKKGELENIQKQSKESGLTDLNLNPEGQKDFIRHTKDANFVKFLEQKKEDAIVGDGMGFNKQDIQDSTVEGLEIIESRNVKGAVENKINIEHNKRVLRLRHKAGIIDARMGGVIKGNETREQMEEKVRDLSSGIGISEERSRYAIKKANEDGNNGSAGLALLKDAIRNKDLKGIQITPEQDKFYNKNLANNIKNIEIKSSIESANALQKLGLTAGGVIWELLRLQASLMQTNILVAYQQSLMSGLKPPEVGVPKPVQQVKSGGGFISAQGLASGGPVYRREGGNSGDTIPAMLTPGEFVMRREAVQRNGIGVMNHLNNGGSVPMNTPELIAKVAGVTTLAGMAYAASHYAKKFGAGVNPPVVPGGVAHNLTPKKNIISEVAERLKVWNAMSPEQRAAVSALRQGAVAKPPTPVVPIGPPIAAAPAVTNTDVVPKPRLEYKNLSAKDVLSRNLTPIENLNQANTSREFRRNNPLTPEAKSIREEMWRNRTGAMGSRTTAAPVPQAATQPAGAIPAAQGVRPAAQGVRPAAPVRPAAVNLTAGFPGLAAIGPVAAGLGMGIFNAGDANKEGNYANPTTHQLTQGMNNFLTLGDQNEKPSNGYFDVNAAGTSILQGTLGAIGNIAMLPVALGETIGNVLYGTGTFEDAQNQAISGTKNTINAIRKPISNTISDVGTLGFFNSLRAATGLGNIDYGGQKEPKEDYEAKTPLNGYRRPSWSGAKRPSASIGENLTAGFTGINNIATSFENEITNPNMPAAINEVATEYSTLAASGLNAMVGIKPYVQIIDNSHPPVENTSNFKKASDAHQAYRRIENFYKVQAYQNWKNANEAEAIVNQPSIWRQSPFGFLGIRGERLERERISKEANEYKEFGEEYHNNRYIGLIKNTSADRGIFAARERLTKEEDPEFQAQQKEAKLKAEEQKDKDRIKDIEDRDNLQTPLQQHSAIEEQGRQNQAKKDYDLVLEQENEQAGPDAPKHPILPEMQAVSPPPTPEQMAKFWADRAAQEETDRVATNVRNAKMDQQNEDMGLSSKREIMIREKIRSDFRPAFWRASLMRNLQKTNMEYTDNAMDGISKYDFQAAVSIKDIWQDYVRGESGTSLMGGRQKEWANLSGGDGKIISEELQRSAVSKKGLEAIGKLFKDDFDTKINLDETFSFMKRNRSKIEPFLDRHYKESKIPLDGSKIFNMLDYSTKSGVLAGRIIPALTDGAFAEKFRGSFYDKRIAENFSKMGLMREMSKYEQKGTSLISDQEIDPEVNHDGGRIPITPENVLQREVDRLTLLHPNGKPQDIKIQAQRNLGIIEKPNVKDGNKPIQGGGNQLKRKAQADMIKAKLRFYKLKRLEFSEIPAYGKALDEHPAMLGMMKTFKEPVTHENYDEKKQIAGLFSLMHTRSLQSISKIKGNDIGGLSPLKSKVEALMRSGLRSPFSNIQSLKSLYGTYGSLNLAGGGNDYRTIKNIDFFINKRKKKSYVPVAANTFDDILGALTGGASSMLPAQWAISNLLTNLNPPIPESVRNIRNQIQELKNGGIVPKGFADGGHVGDVSSSHKESAKLNGFIPRGTDTVPAMLSAGEFVIRKSSVDKYGGDTLGAINKGTMNLASGGSVGSVGGSGGSSVDMTPFMESSRKLTDAINALSGGFGSFTESVGSFNASVGQFGEFANIFAQGAAMIPQSIFMKTENEVLVDMMNMAPAANAIAASIMPLIQQEMVNTINMMNMNNPSYIAQNSGGT